MSDRERVSMDEIEAEDAVSLPNKEVLSLLDVNANVDLGLDLAAPVDLAVAANLNVAAPIEAAASANVLSPDAQAVSLAHQRGSIDQGISGSADATAIQHAGDRAGRTPAAATGRGTRQPARRRRATAPGVAAGAMHCAAGDDRRPSLAGATRRRRGGRRGMARHRRGRRRGRRGDRRGRRRDRRRDRRRTGAVDGAVGGATGAVDGAVGGATGAVDGATGAVGGATGAVGGAVGGATGGVDSLLNGGSLLDAERQHPRAANLTAPIDGAVAANANVAAPIDAAVAANVGSPTRSPRRSRRRRSTSRSTWTT